MFPKESANLYNDMQSPPTVYLSLSNIKYVIICLSLPYSMTSSTSIPAPKLSYILESPDALVAPQNN